jgi:hypothetical protein
MISHGSDYRPIDRRPVRQWSVMNPLSLQKRGLVHWIPCGRLDIMNGIISDRRYRPISSFPLNVNWRVDANHGLYGVAIDAPIVGTFVPRVNVAPLTMTFWARRNPFWTSAGVEICLCNDASATFNAFFTQLTATSFSAYQTESSTYDASAIVNVPVPLLDWHFCAAVFVSNSDRWVYCDGLASAHNTVAKTPVVAKDALRIGSGPQGFGYVSPLQGTALRDIRVYD